MKLIEGRILMFWEEASFTQTYKRRALPPVAPTIILWDRSGLGDRIYRTLRFLAQMKTLPPKLYLSNCKTEQNEMCRGPTEAHTTQSGHHHCCQTQHTALPRTKSSTPACFGLRMSSLSIGTPASVNGAKRLRSSTHFECPLLRWKGAASCVVCHVA